MMTSSYTYLTGILSLTSSSWSFSSSCSCHPAQSPALASITRYIALNIGSTGYVIPIRILQSKAFFHLGCAQVLRFVLVPFLHNLCNVILEQFHEICSKSNPGRRANGPKRSICLIFPYRMRHNLFSQCQILSCLYMDYNTVTIDKVLCASRRSVQTQA